MTAFPRLQRRRGLSRPTTATVVVPCYNYGHYLPQFLATVFDQPGLEVDVIVVDDASPDGSGEAARRLAAQDPRISVIQHEPNQGHIRTYNDGLAAARGEYVTLVSADDLLPAGALTRAVELMQANPSVGLVYGYARSFSGEPPLPADQVRNWSVWSGRAWLRESVGQARCFISSPEVVMRTAALREVGDYDARLPHSADFDLWLRTALAWDIGRVNGADQALYRVHDKNMHLTTYAGYARDLLERRTTFEIFFAEHEKEVDDPAMSARARRGLAVEAVRRALRAVRDHDRDAAAPYLEFAVETDPSITLTNWWQLWRVAGERGTELPLAGPRRLASRARHHLLWRRERRYGF